jgi:F-type H+-transporting ATPase subunit delta
MPAATSTARRYGEALMSFAGDDRTVESFRDSLERLGAAFDRATVAALANPAIPRAQREAAVAAAVKSEPPAIRAVMRLLVERDHVVLVPIIASAFADLVDRRLGIEKARITTAIDLDERDRGALLRRLEERSGKKLRATFAVDPALVGGARVQVGDHLIDASLDARLRALARQLVS